MAGKRPTVTTTQACIQKEMNLIHKQSLTMRCMKHLSNPPYGITDNTTMQGGININHNLQISFLGSNHLTGGIEYLYDEVVDLIPQYNYEIDQQSKNFAAFVQSDWRINKEFTLLTGVRADKHNFLDNAIFSPRVSLLYKLKDYTQFRATWGTEPCTTSFRL